ncbi:FG-GAP repeat domain-containing protein [Aquisphaera giovannonii]|nr:VCBS repeat-containing protein [Aquisphaera giovannonii]
MRRASFIELALVTAAVAGVFWFLRSHPDLGRRAASPTPAATGSSGSFEVAGSRAYDLIEDRFEDGGYAAAMKWSGPIRDETSLQELRESLRGRSRRGLRELRAAYDGLRPDSPPTEQQTIQKASLEQSIGFLHMFEGQFRDASEWLGKALESCKGPKLAPQRQRLRALLGIVALRRGEVANCLECVGPSSCIFPIAREAMHRDQAGSREAVRWFTEYLEEAPRDIRIIWLLNIAYMTLGEHPEGVPPRFLIPADSFRSKADVGRFENAATAAGLTARGPNLAGGSVFDDFDGDGRPDLLTTSLDADLGASLFINKGDGTFDDRSAAARLGDQVYALNVTRADFDNDGRLDVLLLRGGWEKPARMSLLRNVGGAFEDVTMAAGLGLPIASESAAWGDYDDDGLVDVYVCGEFLGPGVKESDPRRPPGDPRNRGRLYHNEGGGKFRDVAEAAGVTNERCGKGSAWGDYDGDGKLDLFVSNMGQECRLYHNEGGGKFRDVAPELGATGPSYSFACWFWDFDNDGLLDLYVNDYRAKVAEVLGTAMGASLPGSSRPRLYRNIGSGAFEEVGRAVGLDRAMAPMGVNFGDVDNDGFLDLYLGTGDMSYEGLDLNLMFRNAGGLKFEDASVSSGTAHLQKGHGVSFADYDGDGDLDLFVELGGATPGDRGYNALFRNPGHGRHWLKVKLVGTKTNRAALGARIRVDRRAADGSAASVYRTVGNNSSFGGNTLTESVGLMDSTTADVTVSWPTSRSTQTFRGVKADRTIEITEGSDAIKILPATAPAGDGRGADDGRAAR